MEKYQSLPLISTPSDSPKITILTPQQQMRPTRLFIERISRDITLQKNENCCRLMRRSYNPIIEDLLEAEERVAETEAAFAQQAEKKEENHRSMQEEYRN